VSNRLKAVTIRIEDELWDRVELLARDRRRRPAELVRLLLQDAIEASRHADVGSEIHA
jgi:predicted transcriptional regulator